MKNQINSLEYFKGDELASSVWKNKYAAEDEVNPDDTHLRLAKEFARVEAKYNQSTIDNETKNKLSKYGRERISKNQNLEDITNKIYNYFKDFKYIIPQGSVMSVLGSDIVGSLSNCFVIDSPHDSYGGIMKSDEEMAQLMKRRGGVGLDISSLRPNGVKVHNSAKTSTGAASFMERYSNTCREVAQQGRRGALMITMDVRHPDILDFVTMKQDLGKVTGANVSVQLRDDFMKAVETDSDYLLRFPCDLTDEDCTKQSNELEYNVLYNLSNQGVKGYIKKIKAKELYDKIVQCAWNTAEPGLMFKDKGINYSPDGVYDEYRFKSSNPCGEQLLDPYNSCRLICMNLYSFVVDPFTPDAGIDFEKLYEVSYEQMILGDGLVDLEIEYVDKILNKIVSEYMESTVESELWLNVRNKAVKSRRVGCGITGLGDMVAAMGYKYDSEESLTAIDAVMKIKMMAELDATIDMAILRGTFAGFNPDLEFEKDNKGILKGKNQFYQMMVEEFPELTSKMYKYGRRNVSWSTIAPTGSVSILTQTTSGCEPLFMPYYQRNKKIQGDEIPDFVDAKGDKWKKFFVIHPKLEVFAEINFPDLEWKNTESGVSYVFEQSPYYNSTAEAIDWKKRVEVQSVLQKYTTNGISSTINLPNDVTVDQVAEIYIESYKKGLKGVTVYRDGCRTGVLVKIEKEQPKERPSSIKGELHFVSNFNIIVGLVNDVPYEVFAFKGDEVNEKHGEIIKENKVYTFKTENANITISEAPIAEERAVTRLISAGLRGGADVKFLVEQLLKTEGSLQSINFALAKALSNYIPDGSKSSLTCNECGSDNTIFEEGCTKCLDCGSSKCG